MSGLSGASVADVFKNDLGRSPAQVGTDVPLSPLWCAVCVLELEESPCWSCGAVIHEIERPAEAPIEGRSQPGMEVEA